MFNIGHMNLKIFLVPFDNKVDRSKSISVFRGLYWGIWEGFIVGVDGNKILFVL